MVRTRVRGRRIGGCYITERAWRVGGRHRDWEIRMAYLRSGGCVRYRAGHMVSDDDGGEC